MEDFPALRVHRTEAGDTRARLERIRLDALNPGEVVVRVRWSSINYKDALAITGRGRIVRRFPCVAGIDLASRSDAFGARALEPMDRAFREENLMVRITGETIALSPPLIVSEDEIGQIVERLGRVLDGLA